MDSALPLLVVDDAKFSLAIITRSLTEAGFRDVRYAGSGAEALSMHADRPAHILISDWLMPEMDGLELTRRIREMDDPSDHFTYVMLMSGQEEKSIVSQAFAEGVDDFVSKSALRTHLLPRVWAACRTAGYNNSLLASNRELRQQIADLERRNMIDAVTGLGNDRFTERALADIVRQVASRGGAACVLLIAIYDYAELAADNDPADVNRVLRAAAARLEQLVRPMDVVTRTRPDTFAVLMHQDTLERCAGKAFRRIQQELSNVKVETMSGVKAVKVVMAAGAADAGGGIPTPDELLDFTYGLIRKAHKDDAIAEGIWGAST
ncbi:MAG TPA: response regulator [Pseudomonadales bacterium]|nr:response regulator [Pseudomonadales bacterium]